MGKAAGGVRDLAQCKQYLELVAELLFWNKDSCPAVDSRLLRFGASSLLPALRACVAQENKKRKVAEVTDETLANQAISLIDHTSLGLDDTEAKIQALVDAAVAQQPHVAAVCIYPKFVKF